MSDLEVELSESGGVNAVGAVNLRVVKAGLVHAGFQVVENDEPGKK